MNRSRGGNVYNLINFQSEKTLPPPASANLVKLSSSGRSKRKRLIIFLIIFLSAFIFYSVNRKDSLLINGRFTKDGVYKIPLPSPSNEDVDEKINNVMITSSTITGGGLGSTDLNGISGENTFIPTAALKKFAAKLHIPIPSFGSGGIGFAANENRISSPSAIAPPSHSDRILLLLNAVKKKDFLVPSDLKERVQRLLPESAAAFSHALSLLKGDSILSNKSIMEDEDDAKLYLESHDSWLTKNRKSFPLTVFSKSYCPFSRKAKQLLTQIGAEFEVFEIDLRKDSNELQEILHDLSGHKTFPTIFIGDSLIGGSDDLARLQSTGMLHGILEAAGVNFKPVKG